MRGWHGLRSARCAPASVRPTTPTLRRSPASSRAGASVTKRPRVRPKTRSWRRRRMDNAVALVRAYLHVTGYFTVTEYPVLEAERHSGFRTVTDLDVLAFRFAGAGRRLHGVEAGAAGRHGPPFEPDPALGVPADRSDMLVAEVKERSEERRVGSAWRGR